MNATSGGFATRRLTRAGIICLLTVAAMTGCTGQAEAPTSDLPVSTQTDAMATYQLPLDEYILSPLDWYLGNYAENLLVEECMNAQGFNWSVARLDASSLTPSTVQSTSGRKIFNAEIAALYGYHNPEWLSPEIVAQDQALDEQVLTPAKQVGLDACILDDARTALPLPENYTQLATQLTNEALMSALDSAEVVETFPLWRQCMAPLGVPDLPEHPYRMPPASLASSWRIGDPSSEALSDEISIAKADAECRASSGFDFALYESEFRLQSAALTANADHLVAERNEGEDYMERVHKVIAEFAG